MTPSIATATMRFHVRIEIVFHRDWNVAGIGSGRTHVLRNDTTLVEIFIHRQNHICFHNRSSFRSKATVLTARALHTNWLLLAKNCCAKNPHDRVSDRCRAKLAEQLPRDEEHHCLSRTLMKRGDKNDTRNSDRPAQIPRLGTR